MRLAFSLVELSIVLVILGLLTGGILTGQSLIRAAELRSVTTEFQRYQAAVQSFRDKYFSLPGDMRNATDFWGAAHATAATCLTTVGTGTQTCNGNGNGKIDDPAAATPAQYGEAFTFWQHLANAGLIEGTYSGRNAGSVHQLNSIIGVNVPSGKLSNAGWGINNRSLAEAYFDSERYITDYGNMMVYGGGNTNSLPVNYIFTPEEAWNIDSKIDDGKPAYGKVIARGWNDKCGTSAAGATSATNLNAVYRLSDTSILCSLSFRQLF
ncbi:MAG: hypothetical protein CMM93_00365 [Rickettsiales bacterium]|nr:hypothetical protein [Rickettsiales bacterium]